MSDATCSACGRAIPPAFPGARVACGCGRVIELAARTSDAGPSGPYRAAAAIAPAEAHAPCPYCGNACPPLVRICPHCDVRLENVRCVRCFSLATPGSFACRRCGDPLALEPMLDPTDAPCPRCATPLEWSPASAEPLHECPRCGGMFVMRDALARILAAAEVGGPLLEPAGARTAAALGPVQYLPCPTCHASMNRVNFGRVSGVIVDVCAKHGTWFDAGELTRAVAFVGAGGLSRARAREADARRIAERERKADAALAIGQTASSRDGALAGGSSLDAWRELLAALLS